MIFINFSVKIQFSVREDEKNKNLRNRLGIAFEGTVERNRKKGNRSLKVFHNTDQDIKELTPATGAPQDKRDMRKLQIGRTLSDLFIIKTQELNFGTSEIFNRYFSLQILFVNMRISFQIQFNKLICFISL